MAINSSALDKFLAAKARPTRLLGDIERHLQRRPEGDRDYTVLHPSDMIKPDWCRRTSYFLLNGHKRLAERPNLRLQNIFDEGHYIHAKWQRWFQEMGVIHGKFKCQVCDKITWGTSPEACEHCAAPWFKLIYDEVTMIDENLRIKGHTDGWIKGIGDDTLIEIKSIGPGTIRSGEPSLMMQANGDHMKAFQLLNKPFPAHILQGQMYLELMQRMGHDVQEIVFLYELKADQSFKEFTVKRDFEMVRHVFDNAQKVIDAVNAGVEPECNNNPGGTCSQCAPYKEN